VNSTAGWRACGKKPGRQSAPGVAAALARAGTAQGRQRAAEESLRNLCRLCVAHSYFRDCETRDMRVCPGRPRSAPAVGKPGSAPRERPHPSRHTGCSRAAGLPDGARRGARFPRPSFPGKPRTAFFQGTACQNPRSSAAVRRVTLRASIPRCAEGPGRGWLLTALLPRARLPRTNCRCYRGGMHGIFGRPGSSQGCLPAGRDLPPIGRPGSAPPPRCWSA